MSHFSNVHWHLQAYCTYLPSFPDIYMYISIYIIYIYICVCVWSDHSTGMRYLWQFLFRNIKDSAYFTPYELTSYLLGTSLFDSQGWINCWSLSAEFTPQLLPSAWPKALSSVKIMYISTVCYKNTDFCTSTFKTQPLMANAQLFIYDM